MSTARFSLSRRILILLLCTFLFTLFHIIRVDVSNTQDHQAHKEKSELVAFHPLPRYTQQTDNRPPLDELIAPNNTIIGDVQFLLDFSIIGFGKCGTSTIMHWLAGHEEIQSFRMEIWDLMVHRPENLIRRLYQELPAGDYKRGYKVRVMLSCCIVSYNAFLT